MSFIAKLQMQNEEEINVLQCHFHFRQSINTSGKAASLPMGGTINVVVESTQHTDFFEWMINPLQTRNGAITFFRYDTMSRLKTLQFENALCVGYHETYDPGSDPPMRVKLILSAQILKLNEAAFKNRWYD